MQSTLPNLWYACDQNINVCQQERFLTPVGYGFVKNDGGSCVPVPIFRNCDQPAPVTNAYNNRYTACSYPQHPIVAEWQPPESGCRPPSPCPAPASPCHDECQHPPPLKKLHCTAVTAPLDCCEDPCAAFKKVAIKDRCCPEKLERRCKCPQTTVVCQEVPSRTMKQPCCNICKFIFPPCREYHKGQPRPAERKPVVWHYFKTSGC